MFNNIGSKLKMIANISCWISVVLFILIGLIIIADGNEAGVFVIIIGVIASWLGNCVLYAFGQLVYDVERLADFFTNEEISVDKKDKNTDKIAMLNKLKNKKLITEEEYRNKLENIK